MTVSIGNTLPGSFGGKSVVQANADNSDSSFQDVLGDNKGHASARHAADHPHRSRGAILHRGVPDGEHHSARIAKEEIAGEADGNKAARFLFTPGKAVRIDDDKTHKTTEKHGEAIPGSAAHERLPLLMSLQEINRASTLGDKQGPTGNTISNTAEDDGMPGSLRAAEAILPDIDPELQEKKPIKTEGPRNIEIQQPASKPAIQATIAVDPPRDPETSVSDGDRKSVAVANLVEATHTTGAATADEPAAHSPTHERVAVVSAQSFPAPAVPGLDPTTSRLVAAIASDIGAQQTQASATLAPTVPHQAPTVAHTLKIELHPAELGMVNASMRLVGEQLSIELLPDTQEAYHRLSSDGDTIARALRDLGFDVGKITVLQPTIAAAPAPRTDAGGSATTLPNRDSSSFQSGQSGSNGNGSGEHHSGRSNDNDAHNSGLPASTARGRTDSGLVI